VTEEASLQAHAEASSNTNLECRWNLFGTYIGTLAILKPLKLLISWVL
jgi:hypothetical protein